MEKRNITNESWMNCLYSTGIRTSYYTWEGKNFFVKGERDDSRIEILDSKLPSNFFENKIVLDIGANIGRISHYVAQKNAKQIYAYEYDKNTCIAFQNILNLEKRKNIKIENKDLRADSIELNSNIALCFSVLHHINPRKKLFEQINNSSIEYIILETALKEFPFNSSYTCKEDEWDFETFQEMDNYIKRNLKNFKLESILGLSERNRWILLYKRKIEFIKM